MTSELEKILAGAVIVVFALINGANLSYNGRRCIPGSMVAINCRECFCAAGRPTGCVKIPCPIENTIDDDDPPLIKTDRMKKTCHQLGQYFEDGCSLCYCTKMGIVGLCTPC